MAMPAIMATLLAALSFLPMADTVSLTVTVIVGQEVGAAGPAGDAGEAAGPRRRARRR